MTVDEAMEFFEKTSIGTPQGSDFVGVVLSSGVALSAEVRRLQAMLDVPTDARELAQLIRSHFRASMNQVSSTPGANPELDGAAQLISTYRARLLDEAAELADVAMAVSKRPDECKRMFEREGFIFDGTGGRWEKLALSLYTMLVIDCEAATEALRKAGDIAGEVGL